MCKALLARKRPYRCAILKFEGELQAARLGQHLQTVDDPLRYHYYVDSWAQRPFKDIIYQWNETTAEDIATTALFVVDGDRMVPLEGQSKILPRDANIRVSRFFYDPHYEDQFQLLFAKFGLRK